DNGIQHVISSPLEHHAVLHVLEALEKSRQIKLTLLAVDAFGRPDLDQLEEELKKSTNTLVSLMHANNEIGTLLDLEKVAILCGQYKALFHCDTVQTMGHYPHEL